MSALALPRVHRELSWPRAMEPGDTGPNVRRLQEWLNLQRCACRIDGEYGPATRAQVLAFQRRERPAEPTGRADLETLHALSAPLRRAFSFDIESGDRRRTIVATAEAHLRRQPREAGGDNRGPWVRAYCGGDGPAWRWCAGFASTIVQHACLIREETPPILFTLSCDELARRAREAGRLTRDPAKVRPGDLFLCARGEGPARDWFHVGLITEVHADYLATIEGNTNDEGSANGYEVCARTRGLAGKDYILLG